jgi:murein DD-endopeptidase MepM/ murein hydrolase activator NlpD
MQTKMLAMFFIALLVGSSSLVAQVAGQFHYPMWESDTAPGCSAPGFKKDQYHLDFNTGYNKFHYGEDWNGKCGGNSDLDQPLRAVADGRIVAIKHEVARGQGKRLFVRHSFPYVFEEDGLKSVDIVYLHLNRFSSDIRENMPVHTGQKLAYIGNTGTSTSDPIYAHLHIQGIWDYENPGQLENPYQFKIDADHAVGHIAPSLLIDDRKKVQRHTTGSTGWCVFKMEGNAPWSTAYCEKAGIRKNIREAIKARWIHEWGTVFNKGNGWYRHLKDTDSFFSDQVWYAYYSFLPDLTMHIPVPGNNFQYDRAINDTIMFLSDRFDGLSIKPKDRNDEIYHSSTLWEGRKIECQNQSGNTANLYHFTYRQLPLYRVIGYYDIDTGDWSGWHHFSKNLLY